MKTLVLEPKTLIQAVYLPSTPLRRVFLTASGAALIAALAQVSLRLPFTPVPVTGQTLGVFLVGAALGSAMGFRSVFLYLLAGAMGLPVFAGGGSGVAWLLGPSGGYLLAFPLAAWLVGYLVERYSADRRPVLALLTMLVASVLVYAGGLTWLKVYLAALGQASDLQTLLKLGFYPFVAGDLLKVVLASGLLPGSWKLVKAFGRL
ncbi:biotin transporter BioY [Oceanithermus sp.]